MEKLGLNEIREKFLAFFESKGHLRLPSFPLVPQGDASLLLINAGMAPLKPYFLGKETPPSKRVTTCQKCIRTPDIECVGLTARHGTFFEMLGNFSFGDYFKKEVTQWAWEFITKVLEIPEDRLWVSVYEEDKETVDLWVKNVGVSPDRIVYLGKEDNFWEIGTGPCGPCSEIYFDRGEEYGCGKPDCAVGCDCDRYVEFWNLVFTQFDKDENGNYNRLAHPNIDTGMGLERIACIMQGVTSIFEVDTIRRILDAAADMAKLTYGKDRNTDVSLRVITDHIRSTVFLVSDGVLPSNEGRGYVLRRLLRRAARHGKLLGIEGPFLYRLARVVANESRQAYPELERNFNYIEKVIKTEEERFDETIDQGLEILKGYIDALKAENKTELPGEQAFKLYDTYGFPIDLTKEILAESDMQVDENAFKELMDRQRSRARSARGDMEDAAWEEDIFAVFEGNTEFTGYDAVETEAVVLGIGKDGGLTETAETGDEIIVVLDKTCFYAESGGQIGDTGVLQNADCMLAVLDTKKKNGKFLHKCMVKQGTIKTGAKITAKIDVDRRRAIGRNHSAVHLLQAALRNVLGSHVAQAGSYVSEERLRFDFSHFEAMTPEQLAQVERQVNEKILEDIPVNCFETSLEEARKIGAVALFSEKYGDRVRVVKMGDYSIELCGGTHVASTGKLGLFRILSEGGVAAGVRRIEGVTGMGVLQALDSCEAILHHAAGALKTTPKELVHKIDGLHEELRECRREIDQLKSKLAKDALGSVMDGAQEVGGTLVAARLLDPGMDMNTLREIGDNLKQQQKDAVIVLASEVGGKVNIIAMATKEAAAKGAHAGKIISVVAKTMGGGGGGKPESAQAGGKDPAKAEEALSQVAGLVAEQLGV
ncbi:alanine--tRNA ligase [Ructibacterium gallinarum]|uniref:Alanine--tRNA ligase n=1 Tax=Ructibacterium gallinarum TaxID=2779355 RepID=A0A9D5M0I9_9FIRM|nr:alanine--tRNA ligase [Ructibacterium gallinarum]MBE5040035.1 alanine--tRNA ligase [Ructibacterium gallinarum]